MKRCCAALIVAVLTAVSAAHAADSTDTYYMIWPQINTTLILTSEHTVGLDFLGARQGPPNVVEPFAYPGNLGVRVSYFNFPQSDLRIGLLAGAWYQSTLVDLGVPKSWEVRFTPDVALYLEPGIGALRLRGQYDIRTFFKDSGVSHSTRARIQARYTLAITGTTRDQGSFYGYSYGEVMMPVGNAAQGMPFINQTQLSAGIGWVASSLVSLEIGYVHQTITRSSGPNERDHVIELTVAIANPTPLLTSPEEMP
jgi:hypothetical protein